MAIGALWDRGAELARKDAFARSKRYGRVYLSLTGLEAAHDRDYTPTGLIGSKLVQELLAANVAVRVVARDPSKLAAEVRTRVDIVRGSSDDVATLERALAGAESLFHMVARP